MKPIRSTSIINWYKQELIYMSSWYNALDIIVSTQPSYKNGAAPM